MDDQPAVYLEQHHAVLRWTEDLDSLFKTFPIHDDLFLQFRAESFNLTNTPQFGAQDPGVNSATFRSQKSLAQSNNPRNVQLALRLNF